MAAKKPSAAMMRKVESSKEDRMRDQRTGTKEGSRKDVKLDNAQARRMMGKKK